MQMPQKGAAPTLLTLGCRRASSRLRHFEFSSDAAQIRSRCNRGSSSHFKCGSASVPIHLRSIGDSHAHIGSRVALRPRVGQQPVHLQAAKALRRTVRLDTGLDDCHVASVEFCPLKPLLCVTRPAVEFASVLVDEVVDRLARHAASSAREAVCTPSPLYKVAKSGSAWEGGQAYSRRGKRYLLGLATPAHLLPAPCPSGLPGSLGRDRCPKPVARNPSSRARRPKQKGATQKSVKHPEPASRNRKARHKKARNKKAPRSSGARCALPRASRRLPAPSSAAQPPRRLPIAPTQQLRAALARSLVATQRQSLRHLGSHRTLQRGLAAQPGRWRLRGKEKRPCGACAPRWLPCRARTQKTDGGAACQWRRFVSHKGWLRLRRTAWRRQRAGQHIWRQCHLEAAPVRGLHAQQLARKHAGWAWDLE